MFHLFQHQSGKLKGKYDFAFIKNGKYICGSNQGYEKRLFVFKAILSIMGKLAEVQDDTFEKPMVYLVERQPVGNKLFISESKTKPKAKYIPSTIKPKYQPKKNVVSQLTTVDIKRVNDIIKKYEPNKK